MKKKKVFVVALIVMMICVVSASAASSGIWGDMNYNIGQGDANSVFNVNGKYDYLIAGMIAKNVNGSGTKKTVYEGHLSSNGTLVKKASKTVTFTTGYFKEINVGKVGAGKWVISNKAFSGSIDYAGWSGELAYLSSSSSN